MTATATTETDLTHRSISKVHAKLSSVSPAVPAMPNHITASLTMWKTGWKQYLLYCGRLRLFSKFKFSWWVTVFSWLLTSIAHWVLSINLLLKLCISCGKVVRQAGVQKVERNSIQRELSCALLLHSTFSWDSVVGTRADQIWNGNK